MKKIFLLLICFTVCHFLLDAQPLDIKFEHLTTNNGLSQSTVEIIFQDSKGFLWFGTQDGLNKFDGRKFIVYKYNPKDTTSISNNYIKCISEDKNGNLWIGTYGGGLNVFDRETETFKHYVYDPQDPTSIVNNVIYSLYRDKKGTLWIGTKGGLVRFNEGIETFSHYSYDPNAHNGITNNRVYCITEDKTGDIWIGTKNKLNIFNPVTEKFKVFSHDPNNPSSISNDDIRSLFRDSQENIWIGTKYGGLNLYQGDTQTFRRFTKKENPNNPTGQNYVRSVMEDQSGNLWIGTFGGGLELYDYETESFYAFKNQLRNPQSLCDNNVVEVFQDKSATIWIGTHGGGMSYFNLESKKFNHYFDKQPSVGLVRSNIVNCIISDHKSSIWIGTDEGLKLLIRDNKEQSIIKSYGNSFEHIYPKKGNNEIRIWSMYEDSEHTIWLGVWGVGLVAFDRESRKVKKTYSFNGTNTGPPNNIIDKITEDNEGNIWIGMEDGATAGLSMLNKKTGIFINYTNDLNNTNSLSNNRVHDLLFDRNNNLWIATDYGLDKFDKKTATFEHFRNNPGNTAGLSYNVIHRIFQDRKGTIWLGTAGGGLNKMMITKDPEKVSYHFKSYTHSDGLANNVIAGITEDNNDNLWISTNKGLSRFDSKTETFKNYDKTDGLQSNEFNVRAAARSVQGEVFFGGDFGLNTFYPSQVKDNPIVPQLAITSFKVFNKELPLSTHISTTKHISLPYDKHSISIEFAALHFTNLGKNSFAYMLEGLDEDWNRTNSNIVHYTNLSYGIYTFRLKACNSDGVWNETGISFQLEITPPFWKAPWFIILASLAIVLVIFGLLRIREQSLQKAQEDLKKEVASRTKAVWDEKKRVEEASRKISNQNKALEEQQRRMQMAHQQLIKEKELVQKQNAIIESSLKQIASQKNDIEVKNDSLLKAQQTIQERNLQLNEINADLEIKVAERTKKLREMFEEVTAVNKELDTFVYRASHDLRGPISRILGLCNLSLIDTEADSTEYIRKMYNTADEMNLMLYRLLEINTLKTSSLNISEVNVSTVLYKVLQNFFPDPDNITNLTLDIKLDNDQALMTDNELLSIVLKNLVENAIKFNSKTSPKIIIEYLKDEKEAIFRVKDNGMGIRKDFFEKIFNMFFVGDENIKGAGLGLYACKMAVNKLDGTVQLIKEVGFSTTFEVRLPLQKVNILID